MRNYASSRYGGWGSNSKRKTFKCRRFFKNVPDLYELIKADIIKRRDMDYLSYIVKAEFYANDFHVPIHKVTQIFMKLNHEGLLSRKISEKSDYKWNASHYMIVPRQKS